MALNGFALRGTHRSVINHKKAYVPYFRVMPMFPQTTPVICMDKVVYIYPGANVWCPPGVNVTQEQKNGTAQGSGILVPGT